MSSLISKIFQLKNTTEGRTIWSSPSNIALIKYWGKKSHQIPMNPSLSLTLSECMTEMDFKWQKSDSGFKLKFTLEGKEQLLFQEKTEKFLLSLSDRYPFIKNTVFIIDSKNTFPHSAGIASSASSMSAIALCLCTLIKNESDDLADKNEFYEEASFVARLGSGSACRSVFGGVNSWGKESDLYTSKLRDVDPIFTNYQDAILIVDGGVKEISSRAGHALMENHAFKSNRITQVDNNYTRLEKALKAGDEVVFQEVVENEAMTLHALMMASEPSYTLLKPNTLLLMEKIKTWRLKEKILVSMTLDAGPNIHLLYSAKNKAVVEKFIKNELTEYLCNGKWLSDYVGTGPIERISR
jgi:diphosphomevalonate decarboxylase